MARLRERVMIWKRAAPLLEEIRQREIREASTADAMKAFTGAALWAAEHRPPLPTSGLVEQQRWFMKAHPRRTN